jgi:hypothetical protein
MEPGTKRFAPRLSLARHNAVRDRLCACDRRHQCEERKRTWQFEQVSACTKGNAHWAVENFCALTMITVEPGGDG